MINGVWFINEKTNIFNISVTFQLIRLFKLLKSIINFNYYELKLLYESNDSNRWEISVTKIVPKQN